MPTSRRGARGGRDRPGEFVAQVAGEKPSHIIAPIIHKSKHEVSELYGKKLGARTSNRPGDHRLHERPPQGKIPAADVGITGANFGLAREGAVVIVENEGNARLCSTLPRVHVIVMGIERLLPSARELPLFLSLLTVSATGQAIRTTCPSSALPGFLGEGRPGGRAPCARGQRQKSHLGGP